MSTLPALLRTGRPSRRVPVAVLAPADALVAAVVLRRSQWRRLAAAEALLVGVLVAVALAGVGGVALVALGVARGALPWLLGGVGAVGLGFCAWLLVARMRLSHDLARWAADQALQLSPISPAAEPLRTGIELAARAGSLTIGSRRLVDHALHQAAAHVEALDRARAALRGRLWQYTVILAVSAAAWAWSTVATPQIWRELMQDGAGVPPPIELGTLVGDVRARVEPPPYARKTVPPREEEATDLVVLRGSTVVIEAMQLPGIDVEAVEVETAVAGGWRNETLPMARRPAAVGAQPVVAWRRAQLEPVRYRYLGRAGDGRRLREHGWREIQTVADRAPTVVIKAPVGEVEVKSGETVRLQGEASDDIGLQVLNLVVVRPSSGIERRPVALSGDTHATFDVMLQADELQLRPGDVALVHFEAADNNPLEASRRSASQKLRIRMFSSERHHARNVDGLAQLVEAWTLRLADRLERDPSARQGSLGWALKNRAELASSEQQAMEALRQVRRAFDDDVVARRRTVADLAELERQLTEPLNDEARALARTEAGATGYAAVRDLYTVQRHHGQVLAAQELAVSALADLASSEHQGALARDGTALADVEKQLLAALERLADKDAGPLQAEAERLIDVVQAQLDRMTAAAMTQLRLVPYEHLNAAGLDAGGLQRDLVEHREALDAVRQLLRQGRTRDALERMRQVHDAVQAALAGLQQGVDRRRSAEEAALDRLIADLRRGIQQVRQGQGRLRDDVRPASEEQLRNLQEQMRAARATVVPRVQELLDAARDQIRPQGLQSKTQAAGRSAMSARDAIATAQGALAGGQLDQALQLLIEAQDLLAGGQKELRAVAAHSANGDRMASDLARFFAASERVERAAGLLREAIPAYDRLLRPATRQRLEGNTLQQEQLRRALDKVRQQLGQAAGAHPALRHQVGDRLDHALQTMREAKDALERYDAARAFDHTGETLDALEAAAERLEPQPAPSGQGTAGSAMSPSDGEVEIEARNHGDRGDTFRQEVLRAMQQPVPSGWNERLQRYYKAIAH
jgi:hypothetical protein